MRHDRSSDSLPALENKRRSHSSYYDATLTCSSLSSMRVYLIPFRDSTIVHKYQVGLLAVDAEVGY